MRSSTQQLLSNIWDYLGAQDALWFLSLLSVISLPVLLFQCYRATWSPFQKSQDDDVERSGEWKGVMNDVIELHGGYTIFALMVARMLGCVVLFIVSLFLELKDYPHGLTSQRLVRGMVLYYLYTMVLSFVSLCKTRWQRVFSQHCFALLFGSLAVNAYRNLWPLATYTTTPADAQEGPFLWVKMAMLFITAAFIPVFSPWKYIPLDPKDPAETPNPEQTTSWFSLAVYTFLDPLLFLAARKPHLGHQDLFPLADYDRSKNTTRRGFPNLDVFQGAKKRHLFWGLMKTYRYEYFILALSVITLSIANFASPMGIKEILHYIETGGSDATIKPWFWISWLFIGPFIISLTRQCYVFVATRMLVQTEGLLTQLIFEHSLRVRMKAEPSDGPEKLSRESAGVQRESRRGKSDNLVGKINNHVTTDMVNVVEARDFLFLILYTPLQIIFCITFLFRVLGPSSFVGFAVILAMTPLPVMMAKLIRKTQVERLKMTDSRIQAVTETCNVLRMVKLFGWESEMSDRIYARREEEVKLLRRRKIYDIGVNLTNIIIPAFTLLATYGVHTVVLKKPLSTAMVYSSLSVFTLLRRSLQNAFQGLSTVIEGKVSLDRLNDFLHNTELLDVYQSHSTAVSNDYQSFPPSEAIGFYSANFTWSNESGADGQAFTLRVKGELIFKEGSINLVIGPTGSGKTSLLMALLGEMHFIPTQPDSWFGLPREKGLAYAAQESWVQNDTIRENILFGSQYDEDRYKAVVYQCGLERDLELFEAGDMTEVGEKGLSLSGGQKARITLARAVYSKAQILLLDDVFAALDVHTSVWIVDRCLRGHLLKGRTVILVTHNIALTSPLADFIVTMGNGSIVSQGTDVSSAISKNTKLALEAEVKEVSDDSVREPVDEKPSTPANDASKGKLIVSEEIHEGHVTWKAMKLFFASLGGQHVILFFLIYSSGLLFTELGTMSQTYFLGYWGSQYNERVPSEINPLFYLGGYALILSFLIVMYLSSNLYYLHGVIRACTTIHKKLVDAILGTTFRWLDKTPTARIITRCTQDIRAVDGPIAQWTLVLTEMSIAIITKLVVVVMFSPVFIIPAIFVAAVGGLLAKFYLKAQLSVKREMSNAKAPVLAHFGAAIAGLTSIRAYEAQDALRQESLKRIDFYSRVARVSYNLNRWIGIRVDILGAMFTTSLATYLVYASSIDPASIGFSLNMAVDFCGMILWWVRVFNDLEVQANSLERIQGYVEIDQEPKPREGGVPPAAWPTSGHLRVEKLFARYSKDGPNVLHNVSFEVASGERIGVVGRTGSGKSSLMLSLLRCIVVDGDVYYDGINTKHVNLDSLRSTITIIPQMPELLSGTLRRNLDPFEQHDDATLNAALRASGLFSLQTGDDNKLTLDSQISSGGSNLSVGQRQILALARAMVRESKLLILDEATSAIDYKTDTIIQQSLRNELGKDVTIITVAHRLQTIMDADKILVLDAGQIVEYDSPAALLAKPSGNFKSMVDGSGDKERLYSMVHRAGSK